MSDLGLRASAGDYHHCRLAQITYLPIECYLIDMKEQHLLSSVNKKWFEYISRRVQVKYIIKMYPIVFFPGSDECRKCPVFLLGLRKI